MPVDNDMYDSLAEAWWDEQSEMATLSSLDPVRFGYFEKVLRNKVAVDPHGKRVLDIGCGGGLLAERFAGIGCQVTGIDPSGPSIQAARAHAQQTGLEIEYCVGSGEELPFPNGSFDIVCCADVLEHVDDLEVVLRESARVMGSGGIYLFLTVNRTLRSNLTVIKILQEWKSTRYLRPDTHDWKMFIKPREMKKLLARDGIDQHETVGVVPAGNPIRLLRLLRKRSNGEIGYAEMAGAMKMKIGRDTSALYAGYGVKGS